MKAIKKSKTGGYLMGYKKEVINSIREAKYNIWVNIERGVVGFEIAKKAYLDLEIIELKLSKNIKYAVDNVYKSEHNKYIELKRIKTKDG